MEQNQEDLFIKPGNQERGWNDPPQFSYGLQTRGAKTSRLYQRERPTGPGTPPMTPPTSNLAPPLSVGTPPLSAGAPPLSAGAPPLSAGAPPLSAGAPPLSAGAPPPFSPVPPPIGSRVAPPPASGPIRAHNGSVQSEPEPEVEEVMSVLRAALEACRENVSSQLCVEIEKRLKLLLQCWTSGRLSSGVKRRMKSLSSDLVATRWDSADEAHRSLMVDHVTEVGQWMVGIKRLIAETRKLSPEHLRPLTALDCDVTGSS